MSGECRSGAGDVRYKKNVRNELPIEPACGGGGDGSVEPGPGITPGGATVWRRGMRRWTALPDVVEVCI